MTRSPAPDFNLADQHGVQRSLSEFSGRWIVLYFYPHDRSLNCTKQACNFRDEYRAIHQFGSAEVIGVNHGSVASHAAFAKRHGLTFPILSDPGHTTTSAYGAWRTNSGKLYDRPFGTRRNTYLIDPDGVIVKTYIAVDPNTHTQQVIEDLHELQTTHTSRANRASA